MPDPQESVQRWGWCLGADGEHGGIDHRPDGGYVKYEDYLAEKQAREALRGGLEAEIERLRSEAKEAEHVKGKLYREAEDIDARYMGDAEPFVYKAEHYAEFADRLDQLLQQPTEGGEQ